MDKLKGRMKQLKNDIEEVEQREFDAKNSTKEVEEKFEKKEGERTTLASRINVVRAELVKIRKRLAEANEKLEDAEDRSSHSEVRRKQLAVTEVDDFDYSEEVGSAVKTAATTRTSAEHTVAEAERKVVVLEADLSRADKKREAFVARVDALSTKIAQIGDEIRALTDADLDASQREDVSEDKAKFLEAQVRQTLAKAEAQERQNVTSGRTCDELKLEIGTWIEKLENVNEQMDEMSCIIGD